MTAKKIIFTLLRSCAYLLLGIVGYLVLSVLLPYLPYPESVKPEPDTAKCRIYLLSNGVHTDLVLPINDSTPAFFQKIKAPGEKRYRYLAIGWGDKGFYLHTPKWKDLTAKTAFRALFGLGGAAMHCTWYEQLREHDQCAAIDLTEAQYLKLCQRIEAQFKINDGEPISINGYTYGTHDRFFEANGRYAFFNSCNTWTNKVLKSAQVPTACWTIYPQPLFYHIRK